MNEQVLQVVNQKLVERSIGKKELYRSCCETERVNLDFRQTSTPTIKPSIAKTVDIHV